MATSRQTDGVASLTRSAPPLHLDTTIWVAVVITVMVVIGAERMPYGYYMILRVVICGVSAFLVFNQDMNVPVWQRWPLGASAIVYNPLLPLRLGDKELWLLVNGATVILLWTVAATSRWAARSARLARVRATDTIVDPPSNPTVVDAERVMPCPSCSQQLAGPSTGHPVLRCPRCKHVFRL